MVIQSSHLWPEVLSCHNTDVPECKTFASKEQTVGSKGLWIHIVVACVAVLVYFII